MDQIEGKYLSLSEEVNALDFLEKANDFIKIVDKHPIAWKWIVISLHGALYSFAICACKGTNPDNVTTKKGNKLISIQKALERCQNPKTMKMLIHSKHLILTQQQEESIKILVNILRNNFEHYKPKLWSIELHGMPRIAMDVLDVIHFLALETNTYVDLDESQIRQVETLISESKHILEQSLLYSELQYLKNK